MLLCKVLVKFVLIRSPKNLAAFVHLFRYTFGLLPITFVHHFVVLSAIHLYVSFHCFVAPSVPMLKVTPSGHPRPSGDLFLEEST